MASWFDNLVQGAENVGNTVVQQAKAAIVGASETIVGVVAHPVTLITQGLGAARAQAASDSLVQNLTGIGLTTAAAVGAVTGVGAVADAVAAGSAGEVVASTVGTVAKAVIANPVKAIVAGATGLAAVGFVSQGGKSAASVANIPEDIENFGSNIATDVNNPSIANTLQIVKQNPILSGLAVLGTGLVTSTALNTVATALNTRATNASTNAPSSTTTTPDAASPAVTINNQIPQTPTSNPVVAKNTTKKKAKKK